MVEKLGGNSSFAQVDINNEKSLETALEGKRDITIGWPKATSIHLVFTA